MEIERKFLVKTPPKNLSTYPSRQIEQGYLCKTPAVRIRRDNDTYWLTYKSKGLMVREEHNLTLDKEAYLHLKTKIDGILIEKNRYEIPDKENLIIELDVFAPPFAPLMLAEVEFSSEEAALSYVPPSWFGEEVTLSGLYHNNNLSAMTIHEIHNLLKNI